MAKKKDEPDKSPATPPEQVNDQTAETEYDQTDESVIEYTLYFKHKAPLRGKPFTLKIKGGQVLSDGIGVIEIQKVNN